MSADERLKAYLNATPSLVPVPTFDRHVITSRQDQAERRVHCQASDVVRVSFERSDLFPSRDVVHAKLEVVGSRDELMSAQMGMDVTYPVLASNVPHASNGNVGDLERLQVCLSLIVPDFDLSVATCQYSCRAVGTY